MLRRCLYTGMVKLKKPAPAAADDDFFALAIPATAHTETAAVLETAARSSALVHGEDDNLFSQVLAQAASAAYEGGGRAHPIDAARRKTKTLQEIKKAKLERKAERNTVVHTTEAQINAVAKARRKTVGGSMEATLKSVRR